MAIPAMMLNDNIKASAEYSKYLTKSKGYKPVKATGRGKGLLTKQGVEIAVERIAEDVDSEEIDEESLVRRIPTGVVIGGEVHRESDEEGVDHSKKLKGL
ncbi:hypothetical protein Tco_0656448 [Tanacetum coccineum]|uniref:Uncharacterized protein n=1 Tax=Tanacetum coccineum TaxID=301880 RepID=A0ABQ4X8X3_9ASTR